MLKNLRHLRRTGLVATGLLLGTMTAIPALLNSYVSALGGQVSSRSITMSSSSPAASATYTVNFKPFTTISNPDVIIDFCSNDPIVGDACTATAGTDTPNMAAAAASGWTVTPIGSNRGVKLVGTHTFTAGSAIAPIVITGVTNPSNVGTNGTFYARIITYPTSGAGTNTSASPGSYTDFGGVALSTASNILVTSKVFETLSFCVFNGSCGTPANNIALGDSTTQALSSSTAEINAQAQYTLATNAASGVVVTMTGQTLCRNAVLNFTNCPTGTSNQTITAMGTTAIVSAVGTEQFGMCAGKNGSAALTVAAAYNDTINNCPGTATATGTYAGTSKFGFDDTNTTGTNSSSGSTVLSSTGAVTSVTSNFAFLGNIATTTEAGVYQSNLNLVATGTF